MKPIGICVLGFGLGCVALGGAARAQLFEQIVGDALTVQVTAGSRSGSVVIPTDALAQISGELRWRWTSPAPVTVAASDGTPLGTFGGRVTYDPSYDNIDFEFTYAAAAADARFTVVSANLVDSFTSGGDNFLVSAHLFDQNGNGASLNGLLGGVFAQAEWNGIAQIAGLSGFSVPAGGDQLRTQLLIAPFGFLSGTKALRSDFTLTAEDRLESMVFSTTSIPAPTGAGLALAAGLLMLQRRREARPGF